METEFTQGYSVQMIEKETSNYSDRFQKVIGIIFDSYQKQKHIETNLSDNSSNYEK